MELYNFTSCAAIVFPSRDPDGRDWWVAAIKGTFRIVPGERMALDDRQEPIAMEDAFSGDAHASSLRIEDDLAPFKPRTDVVVRAVARRQRAAKRWLVTLRVGAIDKTLGVTGPRAWVKGLVGHELTEPEACTEVPIDYERAYGGVFRDRSGAIVDVCQENPVGVGYVTRGEHAGDVVLAPQIEDPKDPIAGLDRVYRPQGLGPMTRSWLPRRALAGTPAERWMKERWPNVPLDFDSAFHNCAHPDLVYPGYLRGHEDIVLEGVEEQPLRVTLPAVRPRVMTLPAQIVPSPVLDTVHVDVVERRVCLTWRCRFRERHVDAVAITFG